jgi:ankyrin repeat protein
MFCCGARNSRWTSAQQSPSSSASLTGARAISLHEATRTGNTELVAWLLAEGAEVNAEDEKGLTPLQLAETDAMKDLLRKHGAK